jgi:hypothetical protein
MGIITFVIILVTFLIIRSIKKYYLSLNNSKLKKIKKIYSIKVCCTFYYKKSVDH